jgi:hypothetical protein
LKPRAWSADAEEGSDGFVAGSAVTRALQIPTLKTQAALSSAILGFIILISGYRC